MRIDVTEVLTSPEFMEQFTVTRQSQRHEGGGVYKNVAESQEIKGVVTVDTGWVARRLAEGVAISGAIKVHTMDRLTSGFGIRDGDIVTHNGKQYLVMSVDDWRRYGRGFTVAHCELSSVGGGGHVEQFD